jgi:hypothetical protein
MIQFVKYTSTRLKRTLLWQYARYNREKVITVNIYVVKLRLGPKKWS